MSAEREPLYARPRAIVIETDGLSFDRLVDEVVRRVGADAER